MSYSERFAAIKAEKEKPSKSLIEGLGGTLIKGLGAAGAAYLTAGMAPALVGGAASLAPTAGTVLPALKAGTDVLMAGDVDPTQAVAFGIQSGAEPTVSKYAQKLEETLAGEKGLKPYSMTGGKVSYATPEMVDKKGRITPSTVTIGKLSRLSAEQYANAVEAYNKGKSISQITAGLRASGIPSQDVAVIIGDITRQTIR